MDTADQNGRDTKFRDCKKTSIIVKIEIFL
jgi:hypothetical protein